MNKEKEKISSVAIYTRVSTEEQARGGLSLGNQLDKLKAHCFARDWEVSGEYVDPGYTGRNIRRPGYQQMIQNMESWDAILVYKMDRIHRNQKNFITMMEHLHKKGKQFVSLQESFDTSTAMGRFVMNIMQGIAQLESEQIGERVMFAMEKKARMGNKFMGHRYPFGYKWDKKKGVFIEKPEELEIVKKVFDLYLNGTVEPLIKTRKGWKSQITGKIVEDRQVKRIQTRYKRGGHSYRSIGSLLGIKAITIRQYLNNTIYVGYERYAYYFMKIKNGFNPIISVDQWNKAQIKIHESSVTAKRYEPILIPEDLPESFELTKEQVKMCKAKYNYNF